MYKSILFFSIGAVAGFLAREILSGVSQTKKPRFVFGYKSTDGLIYIGDFKRMELRKNQTVTVTAKPVGADGAATDIGSGSAVWKSSDESIVKVTVNPSNELEATIAAAGGHGAVVITLEADGDPSSAGDTQIFGSADVRVLGANAVGFDLSFGTPTDATSPAA